MCAATKGTWKTIRLQPNFADAYYNRATIFRATENDQAAIGEYESYLKAGGGVRNGDQAEVEQIVRDLKKRMDGSSHT